MPRQEVVKDVTGQRVWIHPMDSEGHQLARPSSTPSVEIKDEHGNTVTADATTNVTQDPVNTTLSANASKGDKTVTLTSTDDLVLHRSYLITNTQNQTEWVRVVGWNTSTKVVDVDEPLEFDHASTSTFQGTGFYRTLQAAEVATLEEGWRVRASFTSGGLNYIQEVMFDVVLTPLVSMLTAELLKKRWPDIMPGEHEQTRGTEYADLRETAWGKVLKGIRQKGWRPALVRTGDDLEEWALAEFALIAYRDAGVRLIRRGYEPPEAVEELKAERNTIKLNALSSIVFYDANEDDTKSDDEEQPKEMDLVR